MKVGLPTVFIVSAIVGSAAFALGRSTSSQPSTMTPEPPHTSAPVMGADPHEHNELPPGHPPTGGDLPPGHPAIDPNQAPPAPAAASSSEENTRNLDWKVPPRWKTAPNTSSMRIATYKVPHADGDAADADVSVMQAGGTIDANVTRWIGQFSGGGEGKKTKKKVAGYDVTIVEAEGDYGGMGGSAEKGWALLGAIVDTPDMPHFFKIVGPKKTVQSARAELDTLLASLKKSR